MRGPSRIVAGGSRIQLLPIVVALAWTVGFGLAAARMATRLDRFAAAWFVFGAILGPVALIILWLAPPAWCRVCLMPTRGMLGTCWWCGTRFRGQMPAAETLALSPAMASPVATDRGRGKDRDSAEGPAAPASRSVGQVSGRAASSAEPFSERPGAPPAIAPPAPAAARSAPEDAQPQVSSPASAAHADPVPVMDVAGRSGRRSRSVAARTPAAPAPARPQPAPAPPPPQAVAATQPTRPTITATAVFYSGTVRLELGGRYGFVVEEGRLRIVGPLSPSVVAFDRPLAGVSVAVAHGRLLLAFPENRSDDLLVFTSVVGLSLDALADVIERGAQGSVQP